MKKDLAVLFDMDGVICDTNSFHLKAWEKFAEKHQLNLEDKDLGYYIYGRTNRDALQLFIKDKAFANGNTFSADQLTDLSEEKEALFRDIYRDHVELTPGLSDFLEELKKASVPMALASNAPISNIDFILDATGTRSYFSAVVDATQVTKGKPDPQIYLRAAEILKIAPDKCVVMEDSTVGVEAGQKAGMKVVGITTTHSREELDHTDLVIDNFDELTIDQLETLLQSNL
ncbi:HAD family hydrolase [Adhaeribacter radiodurans]|uniref:Beta-phosphoglucomutase n=1 Tax=Adhaeribacter radiodurans TaxID=2745197 RepID=A0A7L7LE22_9BACT|nr:HAD family phosphatase [Adhaeribacter radiodurans]QMU31102.1 HAD family phosphatase [Adhaeribacter radiodurans]